MVTMTSLSELGAEAPQMPRFDNGMVNLQEFFSTMSYFFFNEIMNVQTAYQHRHGKLRSYEKYVHKYVHFCNETRCKVTQSAKGWCALNW